ncbi:MAG: hypothetical protein R2883_08620 [Caldisericia bacterium]
MKKIIVFLLVVMLLFMGSGVSGFEYANFISKPTRFHVKVNSSLAVGRISFDAWDNPEMPQLQRMPRVKVGFAPIVNGTEVWGTNLSRLLTNDGFSDYIARNYPNLKTIEFGEQYEQFMGGELITTSKMYNAITNTGMSKATAEQLAFEAVESEVDWTIPGTEDNFEKIDVYPGYENRVNLGDIFGSELDRKNGRALTAISQGFIPDYGVAEKPLDFTICNPYTSIPVVYAEDQYMDFFFRPIGTIFEQDGGTVISKPSTETACFVKFKYHDTTVKNIPFTKSDDGIDEAEIDLNVRYTGEYRFDFAVDPPQIGGQANLPLVSTGIGEASMFDGDGNQHLVQSFPSLRRFYGWLPHTDPGYTNQRLLITPAVRKKCFYESRLWELSHFKIFYPVARFEDGLQIVTEESVDISPIFFEEISMGEVGYFKFTNLPWLEGNENTHYIYSVDRPMRIVAIYEPGDLTPRGKDVRVESTRITLNWAVTNEMKKLAEIKKREWGDNWWEKHFPTFYTIKVTGENGFNKTFKKINPLTDTLIIEELEPGNEYSWELETWVSDDNGSSSLMNTWTSDKIRTIPLPKLVGHCAKADAIKLETEVNDEGFEVWKIITPMKYKLGSAELQPMSFEARPSARMSPVRLNQLDMVDVSSEVSGATNLIAQ